jgi:hypothetical protein
LEASEKKKKKKQDNVHEFHYGTGMRIEHVPIISLSDRDHISASVLPTIVFFAARAFTGEIRTAGVVESVSESSVGV